LFRCKDLTGDDKNKLIINLTGFTNKSGNRKNLKAESTEIVQPRNPQKTRKYPAPHFNHGWTQINTDFTGRKLRPEA
jgi:hypothetical protein